MSKQTPPPARRIADHLKPDTVSVRIEGTVRLSFAQTVTMDRDEYNDLRTRFNASPSSQALAADLFEYINPTHLDDMDDKDIDEFAAVDD